MAPKTPHEGQTTPSKRVCGAKNRRGGTCRLPPIAGRTRCKFHGGKSLSGPAHPSFKDGRYSKYLPANLAERYLEGRKDPNLIALRDEVALVDVRVSELLEALGETGNAKLWKEARDRFDAFKAAGAKGKGAVGAARLALQQVDDVLERGLSVSATWDELRDTLDLRRKLSESETRRLKDMQLMISAERAYALVAVLMKVINAHVTDDATKALLWDNYRRLVGRPDPGGPAPDTAAG